MVQRRNFEGQLYLLFRICVCILAFLYWKTGIAFAKAMLLPFLLFGFSILFLDRFSEEKAHRFREKIIDVIDGAYWMGLT